MTIEKSDCHFFHVIDLPGGETTEGPWDFRQTEDEYHGNYPLKGKTVLEIGTATGSHAFWMEGQGAEVTPYDLSTDYSWDIMPTYQQDLVEAEKAMRRGITRINNSWHYCRDRLGSQLELTYGSIYNIPPELGQFDVITFGSVLLHVRDPIGAIKSAAERATEAIIITDRLPPNLDNDRPLMEFMPKLEMAKDFGGWTWWWISPKIYENLLSLLGYKHFELTISKHLFVPTNLPVGSIKFWKSPYKKCRNLILNTVNLPNWLISRKHELFTLVARRDPPY